MLGVSQVVSQGRNFQQLFRLQIGRAEVEVAVTSDARGKWYEVLRAVRDEAK